MTVHREKSREYFVLQSIPLHGSYCLHVNNLPNMKKSKHRKTVAPSDPFYKRDAAYAVYPLILLWIRSDVNRIVKHMQLHNVECIGILINVDE